MIIQGIVGRQRLGQVSTYPDFGPTLHRHCINPASQLQQHVHRTGGACVAAVTLRFQHRAECLRPGARLILRDRADGCIAGAGIVRAVFDEDDEADHRAP